MNTILITGASGLVGSNLCLHLKEHFNVVAIHNQHPVEITDCENIALDLLDEKKLYDVLHKFKPQTIIHAAALTNIDYCEYNKSDAYKQNVLITGNLVQLSRDINSRIVYISTDSVFDGKKGNYTEQDLVDPINYYAATKVAAEQEVLKYNNNLVLRSNFFGINIQDKNSLSEWIVDNLSSGCKISVFKDIIFNPILVNELTYYLLRFLYKSELWGIYHLGSQRAISKAEFARAICQTFGFADYDQLLYTESTRNSSFKIRPKNTSLCTDKVQKDLGIVANSVYHDIEILKELYDNGYYSQLKRMNRTTKKEKLIVVIPAFNEEKTIGKVIKELKGFSDIQDIIVVNDASKDNTEILASLSGAKVLTNSENLGYDKSLAKGFAAAIEQNATLIASFDADGQHTLKSLKDVLKPLQERKCDISVGIRPTYARLSEHLYGFLTKLKIGIQDPLCGLKAYRNYVYRTVGFFDKIGSIGTQLLFEAHKHKFSVKQVPISIYNREKNDVPRFGSAIKANVKILWSLSKVWKKYKNL